ncbi:S4 domain-containing protein YaaA [Cohnella sp. REN36]|uniref:S4 domain-containing protein YaaA n=1 Tax=Cohnella sp. REN36 TaxID=2887347 RepID=UPI001D139619|nr:S4 domain-containing protein YaaA [Cohnella sp. REN36]MCC3376768.1 S4 domain-containing protein YaaA [Cohnella sp. REN36]
MKEIDISTEYIQLQQLLQLGDCIGSGGEVKFFLQERQVTVNGEPENRRGRKLRPGDVIEVEGCGTFTVVAR